MKTIKSSKIIPQIVLTATLMIHLISCLNQRPDKKAEINDVKPYPYIIDISEGFKNSSKIRLSDIADSIKYIVLSKEREVIIGSFPFMQMTESDYYLQFRGLIYRFDLSGKFLNTIGKIGRGPEEYLSGSLFTINPSSEIIYVKRNYMHDYISYNSSGAFIGNVSLKKSDNIWEFNCLSDSVFMYTFQYSFMKDKSLEDVILCGLFNKNGTRIQVIEHPAKNAPSDVNMSRFATPLPFFTFYNYDVVLNYVDTIYKITKDSIFPGFILNWGTIPHRQTFGELYYIQTEPLNKVESTGHFFEISDKAYFGLKDMDKYFLFEYDKNTSNTRSMLAKGKEDYGFINDIDGGVSFYPKWTNKAGNVWIDYDDAFNFKKVHNDDFLSSSISISPERKENLKRFLNNLQIDDNPVLKIVYLKKYPKNEKSYRVSPKD
jgi:hypothetical protein